MSAFAKNTKNSNIFNIIGDNVFIGESGKKRGNVQVNFLKQR